MAFSATESAFEGFRLARRAPVAILLWALFYMAVTAVIVVKQGQELSERQVIDHCNAHMAHFKSPKRVVFVEALPKNPSGKLLKRELRKTVAVD